MTKHNTERKVIIIDSRDISTIRAVGNFRIPFALARLKIADSPPKKDKEIYHFSFYIFFVAQTRASLRVCILHFHSVFIPRAKHIASCRFVIGLSSLSHSTLHSYAFPIEYLIFALRHSRTRSPIIILHNNNTIFICSLSLNRSRNVIHLQMWNWYSFLVIHPFYASFCYLFLVNIH